MLGRPNARLGGGSVCSVLLVLWVAPAFAQTESAPSARPSAETSTTDTVADDIPQLVDILVTAQRRSQKIERVPASIQVVSGAAITAFRQTNLSSVAATVPNLVLTSSPSGSVSANTRGIGTPSANAGFEQSVALYVDGIYQPRPHSYTGALFDVDRIEVVKGTQGTLFGKNASVGAISLITRDPGSKLGGYLNASYDFTLDGTRVEGAVDVPVGDTVRLRVAGLYGNDTKGWIRNLTTGNEEPTIEEHGVRVKGEWDVTPDLTLNGKYEYNNLDRVGNAFILVPGNIVGGAVDVGDITKSTSSNFLPDSGGQPALNRRSDTESVGANWSIGDHTITALSAWTKLVLKTNLDFDNTTGPIDYGVRFNERFNQFTQELRVASDENRPFSYLAGLFYLDQSLSYQTIFRFVPSPGDQTLRTGVKTYSGFVQGKYKFTQDLALTAGARLTNEIKRGSLTSIKNAGRGVTAERVETTKVDWNVIAEYMVQPDVRLYATVSRGHKAPGFLNTVPGAAIVPARFTFSGETATNYEVGIKARFLNGGARGNLAVYNLDVKNYQGSEYVPALLSFVASNVDTRSRGVEAELQVQIARDLQIGASGAYNDGIIKATGNQMISAPRWNSTVTVSYTPQLSQSLRGTLSGLLNYTSKFPNQFDLQPGNFTPTRTLLDLRAGARHEPSGIEIALIGRNVTNKRYVDFASGYPFAPTNTVFLDQIARPRTIALELRLPFGQR